MGPLRVSRSFQLVYTIETILPCGAARVAVPSNFGSGSSNEILPPYKPYIVVNRLNAAMVEAALKVLLFFEALGWAMRYWIEQAEASRQVRNIPALPVIVDHEVPLEVQTIQRPLLPCLK